MKQLHIKDLGPRQLWKLRKDIHLGSIFLDDYKNRYGIDPKEVYDFFDGWIDDIYDQMKEEHPGEEIDFWGLIDKYDTCKCLKNYAMSIEW